MADQSGAQEEFLHSGAFGFSGSVGSYRGVIDGTKSRSGGIAFMAESQKLLTK